MSTIGIAPSDIVLFLKFTGSVLDALEEQGGSRRDYQDAIRTCVTLQATLKELGEIRSASNDLIVPTEYQGYTTGPICGSSGAFQDKIGRL